MSRFKGLIADFGGVLTSPLRGVMRDFCLAEGLPPDAMARLLARDPQGRAVFAALERGGITQLEWEEITAALLGVPGEGLLRRMMATLRPAHEMLEAIEAVRRAGFATACLTNSFGLEPFNPYTLWALPERFDVVVISEREKVAKPDPEIYRRTLERLGLAGDACLLLDDTEANLVPARAMGMTAWLIEDPAAAAPAVAAAFGLAAC